MTKIISFLNSHEVPLWWNIISAIFGGLFVLVVVPHFNSNFENNRIRTSFVLSRISQLDSSSNQVAVIANKYIQACLVDSQTDVLALSVAFQESKYEMDLRSAEIVAMMKHPADRKFVIDMHEALGQITLGPDCPTPTVLDERAKQIRLFKLATLDLAARMAASADL